LPAVALYHSERGAMKNEKWLFAEGHLAY
jgi:hypothetical protein